MKKSQENLARMNLGEDDQYEGKEFHKIKSNVHNGRSKSYANLAANRECSNNLINQNTFVDQSTPRTYGDRWSSVNAKDRQSETSFNSDFTKSTGNLAATVCFEKYIF